jgi:hypothetical protein
MKTQTASIVAISILLALLCPARPASADQDPPVKPKKVPKQVWNFDGGAVFQTDGSTTPGACFRVQGRMTAPDFFDDLKRIDDKSGTRYVRGKEQLTKFPGQVYLVFAIYDFPCPRQLEKIGPRIFLTRELMSKLELELFWKRGLAMRPVKKILHRQVDVEELEPYAKSLAAELPKRYEWKYVLSVPSAGVPLTDDLVLLFRNPDGTVAARVAARL